MRRFIGILFRIVFILYCIYVVAISCLFSLSFSEIGIMALKIVFFPITIVGWIPYAMITGVLSGWWFWIWLLGMGSYPISTFVGRLPPIE